eukprot:XP_014045236.1 PREDICTED: myelin regulatory factor-like protein [Salmo salar]
MRVTVQMNTTELLVVHLCHHDETFKCSALMDHDQTNEDDNFINTQGYVHEWPLPVSRFYSSSYHFRSAVAVRTRRFSMCPFLKYQCQTTLSQ